LIVQGQKGLSLVAPSWKQQVGSTPFITNDQAHVPDTLRFTYYGNIQPRFGFSYDAFGNGKIIFKSHIGTYSVPVLGAVLYSLLGVDTSNFPHFQSTATSPLQFQMSSVVREPIWRTAILLERFLRELLYLQAVPDIVVPR